MQSAWRATLEATHRTLGRETIQVRTVLSPPSENSGPLPDTDAEIARIVDALRRAIRLAGLAYATGKMFRLRRRSWIADSGLWIKSEILPSTILNLRSAIFLPLRFTRFCLECLKQPPQDAGTPALTAYLSYLALERNVSDSTQNQALNAMAFLTKRVFCVEDFTIEKPAHGHTYRRPPVVLSRREITAILAHLDDPWNRADRGRRDRLPTKEAARRVREPWGGDRINLAAQLMYGSGLRQMECLRLRVKDFDFDQGTITVHDGKGGKHRVVPLPMALEDHLKAY